MAVLYRPTPGQLPRKSLILLGGRTSGQLANYPPKPLKSLRPTPGVGLPLYYVEGREAPEGPPAPYPAGREGTGPSCAKSCGAQPPEIPLLEPDLVSKVSS